MIDYKKEIDKEIMDQISKGEADWDKISEGYKLSEEFIREFSDKLDWYYITFLRLSDEFMREFADKIHWGMLCEYFDLSEEFMIKFADKIDWGTIYYTKN